MLYHMLYYHLSNCNRFSMVCLNIHRQFLAHDDLESQKICKKVRSDLPSACPWWKPQPCYGAANSHMAYWLAYWLYKAIRSFSNVIKSFSNVCPLVWIKLEIWRMGFLPVVLGVGSKKATRMWTIPILCMTSYDFDLLERSQYWLNGDWKPWSRLIPTGFFSSTFSLVTER